MFQLLVIMTTKDTHTFAINLIYYSRLLGIICSCIHYAWVKVLEIMKQEPFVNQCPLSMEILSRFTVCEKCPCLIRQYPQLQRPHLPDLYAAPIAACIFQC